MENISYNQKTKKRSSARGVERTRRIIIYVILAVISIIWLFPFVYLIAQSFAKSYVYGDFFPKIWTLDNYSRLFGLIVDEGGTNYNYMRWWVNTLIIAICTSIIQTILVLMTSYALSRLRFRGRQGIMKMILVIGMFPGFLGMIVVYYLLKMAGMSSSIFSLILVYICSSAMSYYIAKGFFDTISKSLDEAVLIDGGNNNTIFWRVIMPLSKPIIIYTILISFTAPWGDYMLASYLAQGNKDMYNVAVGLQQMLSIGNINKDFTLFCAGGVFVSIPIMILFFWLQKYYVEGITGGAVKG